MQVDEILAQDSRQQGSPVPPSVIETTTSVALEKGDSRRLGASMCASEQVLVLLVRKTPKGKQPVGQHDKTGDDSQFSPILPERPRDGEALNLSEGEQALIYRRRMRMSQKDMAALVGVKRRRYSEIEGKGSKVMAFAMAVEPLEPHEKCLVWRRRSGWTQQACADLMGITRYWYNLMENGKAGTTKLEAFWNEG